MCNIKEHKNLLQNRVTKKQVEVYFMKKPLDYSFEPEGSTCLWPFVFQIAY